MKTLIITKHDNGNLGIECDFTDVVDRISMIESARLLACYELITRFKENSIPYTPNEDEAGGTK